MSNFKITFLLTVFLTGCNPVSMIEDMQELANDAQLKTNEFNKLSKAELNAEAQIGINHHNGENLSVHIIYPYGSLSAFKVAEVEKKVDEFVDAVFKEKPKVVIVSFQKTVP